MSKAWSGIQSDFRKIEWTKTERTLFCTRTEAKKQISMQVTRMSIERLNAPTNKNCVTMLTVSVCRVLMSCTAFKSTRSINGSIVIKKRNVHPCKTEYKKTRRWTLQQMERNSWALSLSLSLTFWLFQSSAHFWKSPSGSSARGSLGKSSWLSCPLSLAARMLGQTHQKVYLTGEYRWPIWFKWLAFSDSLSQVFRACPSTRQHLLEPWSS